VLLIQNNNQKSLKEGNSVSYVSLAVGVGSFNDPPHRQGLAHFLEHMLFMGSKKYPQENAFSNLISENGGYSNAYTEWEYTNYQFNINSKVLLEALDIFAWIFIDPLLTEGA